MTKCPCGLVEIDLEEILAILPSKESTPLDMRAYAQEICDKLGVGGKEPPIGIVGIKTMAVLDSFDEGKGEVEDKVSIIRGWCIKYDALICSENTEERFTKLTNELAQALSKPVKLPEEYNELILAIGNKYPNETRHQTALRYIKQAEKNSSDEC